MKQLSLSRLRQMADMLQLELDDEELARLRPMVHDLLDVSQRLRRDYGLRLDRPARRPG